MKLRYLTALPFLFVASCAAPPSEQLMERDAAAVTASRQFTLISPDGEWLSWLAPHEGVVNLWIAPTASPENARQLTSETVDRVSNYVWSPDGASLLYTKDSGGNQNFVIYNIPRAGAPARALTPTQETRAAIVAVSPLVPERVLVSLNTRDARWPDIYSLNIRSNELRLLVQNDGYSRFIADPNLVIRAALRSRDDGGADVFAVDSDQISAEPSETIPYEDVRTTSPLGYSADGRTLYWRDSRGRDTAALVAQDVESGAKTVLGAHARADVVSTTMNPVTGRIDAYEVNPLMSEWNGLTSSMQQDLERLSSLLIGDIEINARTNADDKWVVLLKPGSRPSVAYLYDRVSGQVVDLSGRDEPSANAEWPKKHAVMIQSRDGLMQAAYLTLPAGSDRDGDGRPDIPLPLVLFVHGGPWQRTDFGYDPTSAFLSEWGYAVLAPNFRASTGFGKTFLAAGDGEWGRKMQYDLIDATNWAVSHGIAIPAKVAIYGGSYGGYAVLAGLAFAPEKFACGVDLFGPSDLREQVESDAARNEFRRAEYYRRMGDPTSEEGRALLAERSPFLHAGAIRRPLLVAHGTNDPQVNQTQSDRLVEALRLRGATVTYLVFPGEGHGFTRPENTRALRAVTQNFLAQCLGGSAEPFGDSLGSSPLSIPYGAHLISGLKEAMER